MKSSRDLTEEAGESAPILLSRPSRGPLPPPQPEPKEPPRDLPRTQTWANPTSVTKRLGALGLLVATLLMMLSIFADLLASDLPVACKVHDSIFLFPNVTRPADLDAMDRDALGREAAWKIDPLVAYGPRLAIGQDQTPLKTPSRSHPFGTDREGRDVFARVVHGTRSYLVFALAAVLVSVALGALLGGVAGILGGPTDAIVSRGIESVSAFPPLVLVLGVQAAVPKPNLFTLFLAIALTRWPEVARLVRGEVLLATTRDYVLAARALGASPLRVLRRHIAPNVRAPLVVTAAVSVSAIVLTEASLDFLRVGGTTSASWGETMSQFRDAPTAWWLLLFPGLVLVITIVAYNLMGEALRAVLDPRSR